MRYAGQKPILWLMLTFATLATLALVGFLAFIPQHLTLTGTPSPIPGDDWPTYLHDDQRTAASHETLLSPANASRLTRLWAFKTNAGIAASPTIVKGTVYVGSWDGYEYALDATTGFLKWKTFLGKTSGNCVPPLIGITSSATVQNNVLYVGGGDSYWYALDAYTGAVLWRVFTGDNSPTSGFYNWSSPLIYKDSAYIGIASNCDNPLVQGQLLKVDLQSHKITAATQLVNTKEVGGGVWTSPSIDPSTNTVFVTTGTQNQPWQNLTQAIVSLDATTLKIKASWQIPPSQSGGDYDWGTTPILFTDSSGRKLVAGTNKNGFTYAFLRDTISAGPIWEQQTGLGGMCPPCGEGSVSSGTFADNTLFMAGGNTLIHNIGYPGAVRAIDPSTGKNKWEHGTPYPIIPAIAYVNGLLIDGEGSTIEVLNAHDGSRLYSYETGGTLYAPPAISHGQIFMGSLDGNLYSFGLSNALNDSTSFTPCPRNWSCASVGAPKSNGSIGLATNIWTLTGNSVGLADIFDQFQFVNQSLNGDIQITAKLDSFTNTNAASRTGLMFRQRIERSSPFYAANFLPDGTLNVQYRTAFSGSVTSTQAFTLPGHPHFVAIQRNGDRFQTSLSTDGINYTLLPGSLVTLPFPSQLVGGMFVSSGSIASSSSATFSALSIAPTTLAPLPPESPSACPDGWYCADVGNPSLVGNQLLHNGLWTVQGGGKDIWSTHDEFHYVWQAFPSNSTISAHISNQLLTNPLAKAGLMLRADTSLDAPYYAAFFTPGAGLTVQARSIQGLNAQIVTTNLTMKQPGYLKIARWKNIFTTYSSSDGINWKPVPGSSLTIDIPGSILAGMVLTSHKNYQLGSANFDSLQTSSSAIPAPTACPDSWSCADIGYPSPKGAQLFDAHNKVWTLQGGGFDIYFKADQFHYVWQDTVGDSSISARVSYVSDNEAQGNDYAKAGVMFRQNMDAASPYYAVFLTPAHGVMVQYRQASGAVTGEALFPNSSHNALYLKVLRTGDLYTAYVSQDGVAWQAIDGSTVDITMGDTLMMGLAITSHNPGAVREATFNDLNIS